jgi:CRISPR-associated protein Cpf1
LFARVEFKLTDKNEKGETLEELLNTDFASDKKLMQDKPKTLLIKNFLDALQGNFDDISAGLLHFIKVLKPREEVSDKNETFYSEFEKYYKALSEVTPLYNKARNYLTQRPYSVEKVKLNFENSTLLDGWDENKEADNSCVLFRKDGFYYLGIMDKNHRNIFKEYPKANHGESSYEKMIYKLLPGANKMLPKVFFADSNLQHFNPPEDILRIRNTASHSKNGNPQEGFVKAPFSQADCHKYIDFCKASIAKHWDWNSFGFVFSPTNQYADSSDFYKEIERQGYKITFAHVPESYINQLVDDGKLFLFKIWNKDFSLNKKVQNRNSKPNLHTLYWRLLFDNRNLSDITLKLNGEAEIFFRKKSIPEDKLTVHEKGKPIENKNPFNKKKESVFDYDIIKDKRFTVDTFHFHVPMTLNFGADGSDNINSEINAFLQNNHDINIIGIDRGERHLLYYSLINQKGEILKQHTLNLLGNQNYRDLLDKREGDRDEARKTWNLIENIRNLKEGYLSHVVHEIAKLMIEYNAIIVMEDLNFGFKRGRQKVEKQVYQNFEKMLINKLNYLVFKDRQPDKPGGVLRAYQLANKFESFKKLGKQSGVVFYVPAAYTSAIDPITGFVNFLQPLKADSIEKSKKFYGKFKSIRFNPEKQWFEFDFDYTDFIDKAVGKTNWVACTTNTERYAWNKSLNNGKGDQELVRVTQELEVLFGDYQIPYGSGNNLKDEIINLRDLDKDRTAKKFFSKLNHLLNTTLKVRHNNGKKGDEEQDYILSPVAPFFDSREEAAGKPANADANGAYNIARKGLYLLTERLNKMSVEDFEKTKQSKDGKSQWLPHNEWLRFVQKHSSSL